MKKICLLLLALVLMLTVAPLALAEETDAAEPEAVAMYDSEWRSENAWAEVVAEDGGFKIFIVKDTDGQVCCWQYSALYNGETKRLVSVMNVLKSVVIFTDDGGMEIGDSLYEEEVDASFELNEEGRLIWHDGKEDAGKDIAFEKIGWFDGSTWACDRASIEMYWEEEGYKVNVSWGSSAWEETEWDYSCYYNPENNTLVSMPFGTRTEYEYDDNGLVKNWQEVYNDGNATFSLDDEGRLIWQDEKEDAGAGMRFERMDPADSNG